MAPGGEISAGSGDSLVLYDRWSLLCVIYFLCSSAEEAFPYHVSRSRDVERYIDVKLDMLNSRMFFTTLKSDTRMLLGTLLRNNERDIFLWSVAADQTRIVDSVRLRAHVVLHTTSHKLTTSSARTTSHNILIPSNFLWTVLSNKGA